ncbi:hypothetical protein UFOVP1597_4 [uncultured Caudovirales phage]|jgi:hypothetical protein|uniref:Lipoprotein n=1 Tax=uncultured Caudovirales phage TaxID=2100421 RepID=A0A6J5SSF8_9CAUD|nr:hypothetical protein UFOVP1597_4 [uncultured Caudovirales phage]
MITTIAKPFKKLRLILIFLLGMVLAMLQGCAPGMLGEVVQNITEGIYHEQLEHQDGKEHKH